MGRGEVKNGVPNSHTDQQPPVYKIGIYGWRKRCLYCFILVLLIIMIVNLALTVWIMKTVDFNLDGIGKMSIRENGIRVDGETEFAKRVQASGISSRDDEPLVINSARNVTINARDHNDQVNTRLVIGDRMAELYCQHFEVRNSEGSPYFYVNEDEMYVGPKQLKVKGLKGTAFSSAILTPLLKAESGEGLRCESPMGKLSVEAPSGVTIHSAGGNVDASASGDLKLKGKKVTIDASDIELVGVPEVTRASGSRANDEVFQLCICQSGRLFLAPANGNCRTSRDICHE